MTTKRMSTITVATALAVSSLFWGTGAAFAHGGAVTPSSEQQECRDLTLYTKGQGMHAIGGLRVAGDRGAAADGGHCG